MKDERIEQLLRKAPRSSAPAGLLERLQADITLPRRIETRQVHPTEVLTFIRRWFPAVSFAAIFLACIVAIAVQTNQIAGLKHENATPQTSAQSLEQLRRDNAEYQRLKAAHEELERLRRDLAELQQLRTEVAQLRAQKQEIDKLRAENQQLALAVQQPRQSNANDDFFARNDNALENARTKAESMACINNLKQIGLAARIYATDQGGMFPPSFVAMSNVLSTPKLLICPSDKARAAASDWQNFSAANVSYEFLNPNGTDNEPQVILARCPVHRHVCTSDGAVHQISPASEARMIAVKNGKLIFTPSIGLSPSPSVAPLTTNRIDSERYKLIPVEPPKPSYE